MTSLLGYFQDGAGPWPEFRRCSRTLRDLNPLLPGGDAFSAETDALILFQTPEMNALNRASVR